MDKSRPDLYADYLISSFGPTTAMGLASLLDAGLWRVVKPLVRKVQSAEAVLVIGESILHKPHTDEGVPMRG